MASTFSGLRPASLGNDEKSLMIDIYPGFGWDHLRFIDLSPIYDVSNYNNSDAYQSCIEVIPIYQNKVELGSTVIDMFDARSSDYGSNLMIGGSASYRGFKIGGSFSTEHQTIRKEQGSQQTITMRNQIDYLMVDVILKASCPLHPQVKKDLIEISKYETSEQTKMATYAAQLFVKKYGTHYTNRFYLGGSIIEEDHIQKSDYEQNAVDKSAYHAAAEASFLNTFSISTSFSSSTTNSNTEEQKKKITRKVINSKGGKISLSNGTIETWQQSVEAKPVIVRRAIENITFVIQSDQIPELSEIDLARVRRKISQAIETYIQMNVISGCMDRTSSSFNWIANINDGSCPPAKQNLQFGGFIRTCSEEDGLVQKCNQHRLNNFYTNTENCPSGFTKYPLHQTIQYENKFSQQCKSCGFLGWSRCCSDVVVGIGRRDLSLSTCYGQIQDVSTNTKDSTTTGSNVIPQENFQNYVFGGSFTSQKYNPVTSAHTCPNDEFQKVNVLDDIQLCLAERVSNTEVLNLPHFGGMFSCTEGNAATGSNKMGCLSGYTAYAVGTIEGDCILYVCLDFQQFEDIRQFPSIVLPPFFSIDIKNQTNNFLNSTENGSSQTTISTIQTTTASTSKNNHTALSVSIIALVIGLITIAIISYFVIKTKRSEQLTASQKNSKTPTQISTEA